MGDTRLEQEDLTRALYATHGSALQSYAQHLVDGDRQLAEDIVQETLLRAWRHSDELDVATARPWLFTTTRRLVIDHLRARRVRPVELPSDDLERATTADDIDRALDAVVVTDALLSLSGAHREVLVESYYAGRSVSQVAAQLGVPEGTVRSRIHYALRAMRLALQERGVSR